MPVPASVTQKTLPQDRKVTRNRALSLPDSLDDRGAWVTNDGLRYHKKPGPVIDVRVAVANLTLLAGYLAERPDGR